MLSRRAVMLGLPLAAAGCGGQSVWAPDDAVARVRFVAPGPPSIALYTSLNNDTRNGAHTGLLITASERVIFDPAGSFRSDAVAERNDVVYGASDAVVAAYELFQGSEAYHMVKLTRIVSPEVAEMALQAVKSAGPVGKTQCTRVTAQVLRTLPGFETLHPSLFPDNLMRQFARLPGVTAELLYTDDDEWKAAATAAYQADVVAVLQPVSQSTP
jgi:hypothetical protein